MLARVCKKLRMNKRERERERGKNAMRMNNFFFGGNMPHSKLNKKNRKKKRELVSVRCV